ncbi:hypothetical protein [Bosea sp. RAC05]|uniref:hypothetical protein n=1 Tax=Bosea sp. RAC05 TaxID=1842539 RepID=UPI00083E35A3|nr:hypothetical protein [Bosea sp. RAC05]AOG04554.1 hypothetical protein BSY19_1714 [Bosea sp. RAC05]
MAYRVWKVTGALKDGKHVLGPVSVNVRGVPSLRMPVRAFVNELNGLEQFVRQMFIEEPARITEEVESMEAWRTFLRLLGIRSQKTLETTCTSYEIIRKGPSAYEFYRLTRHPQYRGLIDDKRYPRIALDVAAPDSLVGILRQSFYS